MALRVFASRRAPTGVPLSKNTPLSEQLAKARKAITLLVDRTETIRQDVAKTQAAVGVADASLRTAEAVRTDLDSVLHDVAKLQGIVAGLTDRVEKLEQAPSVAAGESAAPAEGSDVVPTTLTSVADAADDDVGPAGSSPIDLTGQQDIRLAAIERRLAALEHEGSPSHGGRRRGGGAPRVTNAAELRQAGSVADVDVDGSTATAVSRVIVSGFPHGTRMNQLRMRLEGAGTIVSFLVRRAHASGDLRGGRGSSSDLAEIALVTYSEASAAIRAVENLDGIQVQGSRIRIRSCTPAMLAPSAVETLPSSSAVPETDTDSSTAQVPPAGAAAA